MIRFQEAQLALNTAAVDYERIARELQHARDTYYPVQDVATLDTRREEAVARLRYAAYTFAKEVARHNPRAF